MVLDTASRVSEETKATPETEASAREVEAPEPAVAEPEAQRSELLSPQQLALLRKVVPLVWILAAIVVDVVWGIQMMLLVLAAGAVALVITLLWGSVQSLTGGTPLGFEEALGMGAPSKVEEEKRSVLRALKDLEYERSVGKISPQDYAQLLAQYRAEAKRLIQSVDESLGSAREEVEKSLEQRLARAGITPAPKPEAAPAPEAEAKAEPQAEAEAKAEPQAEAEAKAEPQAAPEAPAKPEETP
jgi:hypothetical protein